MKCKRCGGDFPHKRGTYCGECEPDARPGTEGAGETAERGIICAYCGNYTLYAETDNTSLEHARQAMIAHDAVCPRNPLVARIRELEVAAEARAAMLADAATVWVATDKTGTSRMFSAHPATIAATLQPFWGGELSLALTPPGTCIRYRLVPDPE